MGNTVSAAAQLVASTVLVVGGGFLAVASFGGAGVLAAGMISAGVSGAVTTITNVAQKKPASWREWGVSLGVGAATGLLGGAIGAGAGALAKGAAESVKLTAWGIRFVQGAYITGGSTVSSAGCNTLSNVLHGRKPLDGWKSALLTGAVGGIFACGGTALAHSMKDRTALANSMKRSTTSFFTHPVTRHSVGVAMDSVGATASGALGAAMTGQDIGQAAWIGFATGAVAGAAVSSARGGSKRVIRKWQAAEKAAALQRGNPPNQVVNGITFEFDDTIKHAYERHVDMHHTELKNRRNVPQSSRFKDRATADRIRNESVQRLADGFAWPADILAERDAFLLLHQEGVAAKAELRLAGIARKAGPMPANIQRLADALAVQTDVAQRLSAARTRLEANLHTRVGKQTVRIEGDQVLGYGYSRGGANAKAPTRWTNIKTAKSDFKPLLKENGDIVFRHITAHPNYQRVPNEAAQFLRAGDRQFRRRAVGAAVARENAAKYREEDEDIRVRA